MGRPKKYNTKEEELEARRLASRLWYQKNKDKKVVAKCSFQYKECSDVRNHISGTYCQYHSNIMHKSNKYNISPLEVLKMYKVDTCKICDEYMYKKCIDHDHATGKVRGMICQNCNVLLGHAKDDIDILQKCIKYLNESNK
ncbi:MAG: hypothetical protein GY777_01860 [Candidatus Brocadiaceae bacterium]|nr:hypothetical protein [Candidatus Brocadiaceae bacterium]